MNQSEIEKLEVFTVNESRAKEIDISVFYVYRGNFNDERLIEWKSINISELEGKPLKWFDVYLGKKEDNKIKIAFVCLDNDVLYFWEDDGNKRTLKKKESFTYIYSDDYDRSHLIAAHIR